MFDCFSIHIENMQAAIWSIRKLNRTEPDIAGTYEFFVLINTCGRKCCALWDQFFAMHNVTADVADENSPFGCLSPSVAAKDGDAGRSGEVTGWSTAAFDDAFHLLGDT